MAKFEAQVFGRASELARFLDENIVSSGLSVELVDHTIQRVGDAAVYLSVYDKYYMRTGSRAALTVMVVGSTDGNVCTVTAISAGGGRGTLSGFSWGAEGDFVHEVEKLTEQFGKER